ncbi:MAG: Bifunctional ligase/repressor BirA [Planctomycetota bacterium]
MAKFDLDRVARETSMRAIDYHETLGSTNDRAQRLAKENRNWPLLVITEQQVAGRGRGANRWWSSDGALTFSVIAPTPTPADPKLLPQLSLLTALAVRNALHSYTAGHAPTVKWPNDVFIAGRKACGILIERPGDAPEALVIGIGVNVNNDFSGSPEPLHHKATSLRMISGQAIDPTEVLIGILQRLLETLDCCEQAASRLREDWNQHCLLSGRTVTIARGQDQIVGRCQGIRDDGALIIATTSGQEFLHAGVVVAYD